MGQVWSRVVSVFVLSRRTMRMRGPPKIILEIENSQLKGKSHLKDTLLQASKPPVEVDPVYYYDI